MNIFGHEIPMKVQPCAYNGIEQKPDADYVNIYVRITDHCNASCSFCEFRDNTNTKPFDFYKLYYALNEINKQVRINKVSFTGGEPTIEWELLNKCLKMVKNINSNIFTVINSNGFAMNKIDFEHLNSFAMSRHGIASANDSIFKCNVRNDEYLSNLDESIKDKIHLSCNLIKGHIDSNEKMYEYITHYSKLGFHDFGFVTLMGVNEYCKQNIVDFKKLDLTAMKNTIRACTFNDRNACFCANYITHDDNGELNRWYARHYCDSTKAESVLVFDIDHLKIGFNGATILQ